MPNSNQESHRLGLHRGRPILSIINMTKVCWSASSLGASPGATNRPCLTPAWAPPRTRLPASIGVYKPTAPASDFRGPGLQCGRGQIGLMSDQRGSDSQQVSDSGPQAQICVGTAAGPGLRQVRRAGPSVGASEPQAPPERSEHLPLIREIEACPCGPPLSLVFVIEPPSDPLSSDPEQSSQQEYWLYLNLQLP